jgi:hypothetical protein
MFRPCLVSTEDAEIYRQRRIRSMKYSYHSRLISTIGWIIASICCTLYCHAEACDSTKLPPSITTTINSQFNGWKIVTPELLSSPDDTTIWRTHYSDECPGAIIGYFVGKQKEYVVSLVKGSGGALMQQIVFLQPTPMQPKVIVLRPPSHVDVVTVLRKFMPGDYRSTITGGSIRVDSDAIGVSEIEGSTVVYYWSRDEFKQIVTSE